MILVDRAEKSKDRSILKDYKSLAGLCNLVRHQDVRLESLSETG